MVKLFCYSNNKIVYQTEKESEFSIYEIQATMEGLKTVKGEYFPFKLIDGKIILNEDNKPLPLNKAEIVELNQMSLSEYKEIVQKKIIEYFDKSFTDISKNYSNNEREGWAFLVPECEDWLKKGDINSIPALHAETDYTKNLTFITDRAKEVIAKSTDYRSFYGKMKRDKMERVKRLVAAKTPLEVLEIEEELKVI